VARLPGGASGVADNLLSAAGWHATVCELAGVERPGDQWGIGDSFAGLLRGEPQESAENVVVLAEYGQGRMITDGRWKLVLRSEGPCELYDQFNDPNELDNVFDARPSRGIQTDLTAALGDWFAIHERPGMEAFHRSVKGYGQVHPVSRGRSDDEMYVQEPDEDLG